MDSGSRIGAHVSTAGGLYFGVEKAQLIGASAIQIFGSSPRSWQRRNITDDEIQKFIQAKKANITGKVYIHACYLINFGSKNPDLVARSIKSLCDDLNLANSINAYGVVVHPGSLRDGTSLSDIAINIKKVLETVPGAKVIIENSAGGGSTIPRTMREIKDLINLIDNPRAEVCMDTAHLWGFGIDISTPKKVKDFEKELEHTLEDINVPIVHFNDSKVKLGSLLDRHENIGVGQIGLDGLRAIANLSFFKNTDFVLEVPGQERAGPDEENIMVLREILS